MATYWLRKNWDFETDVQALLRGDVPETLSWQLIDFMLLAGAAICPVDQL